MSGKIAPITKGEIEGIGTAPHFVARDADGEPLDEKRWPSATFREPARRVARAGSIIILADDRLVAVGHRVVHGGREYTAPVRLTDAVLAALDALTPLAPLHQPHSLAPVRAITTLRPGLPQVACFDTAFHHTMPAGRHALRPAARIRGRGRPALRLSRPVL